MSWEALKSAVSAVITDNGNNEITGPILETLINNNLIPQLGSAKLQSEAYPTTNPGTPDGDRMYLATTSGVYVNFGGIEVDSEIALLKHTGSGVWEKRVIFKKQKLDVLTDLLNPNNALSVMAEVQNRSKWFVVNPSVTYFDREIAMVKALKYVYCSSSDYVLSQFAKGESSVDKSLAFRNTVTGTTYIIFRGEDSGRKIYHATINNETFIVDVNWDEVEDLSTYYLNTSTVRFLPSNVLLDEYKELVSVLYNTTNVSISGNVYFASGEIRFNVVETSTVEMQKDITVSNEKTLLRFNMADSRDNGCLVGFRDSVNSRRYIFGYEPAFDGIYFFIEGTGFVELISGEEIPSGYIELGAEYVDGEVLGWYNGQSFKVSDYTTNDLTLINQRRLNLKIKNSDFHIKDFSYTEKDTESNIFKKVGGGVYVFKTGLSKGNTSYNDWNFVRTPKNYDPNRDRPYPFVICNHGNGWTMDGTLQNANFSGITQFGVDTQNGGAYLDTNAPYYKQYSNETIERLLEAGYVVCGTQNYSNAEYGSDEGRNALQDYFFYMKRKWNVEEKCFMIGASNGCMMTLNGVQILGSEAIKAIVLQYPLCMLFRHYKNYPPHQAAIEAIYGLTGSETDAELHLAFNDHDPEYANSVNVGGLQYKTKLFPPMKIWHSPGDTVTANVNNAIPLIELIERSNGKVEQVVASGQHGDYTHVDAVEILNFFNTYL